MEKDHTQNQEHLLRATGVMCVLVQDINSLEYQTFVRYRRGNLSEAAKRRGVLEESEATTTTTTTSRFVWWSQCYAI